MFCPSCGTEYSIELKYCNRCGANLNTAIASQPDPVVVNLTKPTLIIGTTLAVLTLGGFAGLIEGARALAPIVRENNDPLVVLIVFGMITILTVDVFLVRQLSKVITAALSSTVQPQLKRQNTVATPLPLQFQRPETARLQPAPSVTENTTRFFEPAYRAPSESEDSQSAQNIKS